MNRRTARRARSEQRGERSGLGAGRLERREPNDLVLYPWRDVLCSHPAKAEVSPPYTDLAAFHVVATVP